jgi:beta-barrel assembly-enhancing protease
MKKIFLEFLGLVVLFFGMWFALSRINFTGHIDFSRVNKIKEQKLSKVILDYLKREHEEVESDSVMNLVNGIKDRICADNGINGKEITVHIFRTDEINAFALPDHQLVIFTGLINFSKNPEEVGSVIAHELVHIEHRHVINKLVREIGLSVIIAATGDQKSAAAIKQIMRTVTSSAFDRNLERDADTTAVHYLANAHIDPKHFADFLDRLYKEKPHMPRQMVWISSHPDSGDRVSEILRVKRNLTYNVTDICDSSSWESFKKQMK